MCAPCDSQTSFERQVCRKASHATRTHLATQTSSHPDSTPFTSRRLLASLSAGLLHCVVLLCRCSGSFWLDVWDLFPPVVTWMLFVLYVCACAAMCSVLPLASRYVITPGHCMYAVQVLHFAQSNDVRTSRRRVCDVLEIAMRATPRMHSLREEGNNVSPN